MRRYDGDNMRRLIYLTPAILFCHAAFAQTNPDAAEILKRVSAAYKAATQYELVMDRVEKDPATGEGAGAHILTALKLPDRYRIERRAVGSSNEVNIVVLDGSSLWMYDSELNQYASYPAASIGKDLPQEIGARGVDDSAMSRFRSAQGNAASARFLREENTDIGGTKVACYVVSVMDGDDAYTWWIDKKTNHVVREQDATSMTIFTTVKLGEALPASLFKFDAPAGARKSDPGQR
jgi:outer membrane lipoprotein-sorting protein